MSTLESHFLSIKVTLQSMEEHLKCALELLDRGSLKQQLEEQSLDKNIEISSLDTDSSATESELLEDMLLATLFTENEGDVEGFEDCSLDAPSVEDKSDTGDVESCVLDVLLIEKGNKVFTTSLNSEEANSNDDELVRTRNKNDIDAGTVGLFMHTQFSPSRVREDHEVDFDLIVLDVYSKFGREAIAPYMFDQLPERNGMSRNNMISDFVSLASWYPILVGYFFVNSCNAYTLEYENMILDNEKAKRNGVGAKQWELDKFVDNKGQQQFSELKSDSSRFPGVKNTINSRTCDAYSRAAWKEVLSWQADFDLVLSQVMSSCNLWFLQICNFKNMHLGWVFSDDESDMNTKSLDSDWKEALTWQAHFDLIISKVMTSSDLWFDFESDMKTGGKIWPWEEIEKLLFLITEERTNLISEEGARVEVDNRKCNQLFLVFQPFAPSFRKMNPTVEGTASSGKNGRPFAVINSLGQTGEYGENEFDFGGAGKMLPLQVMSLAELNSTLEYENFFTWMEEKCEAFEVETKKQNNINIEEFLIATHEFSIKSVKPMVNFDIARNYDMLDRIFIGITFPHTANAASSHCLDPEAIPQRRMVKKGNKVVACTLLFPASVKIHPTVHVSLLKRCYEVPPHIAYPLVTDVSSPHCPEPEVVLQRRIVKMGNKAVAQVLVQWLGLSADAATWEYTTVLQTRFPNYDP